MVAGVTSWVKEIKLMVYGINTDTKMVKDIGKRESRLTRLYE